MDKMNIVFINRTDSGGGAARGATQLLGGILQQGASARLFVQSRTENNPFVVAPPALLSKSTGASRRFLEAIITRISSRKTQGLFSPAFIPERLSSRISSFSPDIVHLHWVARMMRLETLCRLDVPIVWTLHDSWPFTGGCFLPFDCTRFKESCGRCPVLGSCKEDDLSRWVLKRKTEAWQNLNLTLVAPSNWMGERAKSSSLFRDKRVEIIPNGIDLLCFTPIDKQTARKQLSLPQDKKLILFGAKSATQDRNKGFYLLRQSLRDIADSSRQGEIELVVFGSSRPKQPPDLGLTTHYMGWQNKDDILAQLYAAADVFVLPSIQENLPYAVMEAMACGTPCVAFDQGGVPDLIDHKVCGYLAKPYETEDLARGIVWILEDQDRYESIAVQSRKKIERGFAIETIAERHLTLYTELLQLS